ncbi:helicase-related protein [Legionella brunensis]|uniref:Preprotein translocase, secretion protein SecA subunit n=1 Tax=Legionella brunensis TaxID=29422 RepID=A0A0W0ST52_9GAMM|nr:helicase-related protein [Legionella brunensis]KTC86512.1 preprotein translocase, secretion protein SecA subunit [Legionella brunensis]
MKTAIAYLLRKITEANIKSALLNDLEPNKNALKRWLAITNHQQFTANCWKYKFTNGESIVAFGIEASDQLLTTSRQPSWYQKIIRGRNYRAKYLCESQSYYKNTLEAWALQKKSTVPGQSEENIEFSWYHRLISWLIAKVDLQWDFNSDDFDDQKLFLHLREHEGIEPDQRDNIPRDIPNEPTSGLKNTPSIREKYSVTKLLSSPQIILNRMAKLGIDTGFVGQEQKEEHSSASVVPPHMQVWLTKLSLHQQVDLSHQHQHLVQQEQQVHTSTTTDLRRVQEAQKWVDNSNLHDVSTASSRLKELKYEASLKWLEILDDACNQEWRQSQKEPWSYSFDQKRSHKLFISNTALEMILRAKGHVRADHSTFDFESFPLGFFLDKDKDGDTFTLKYHEKYRQYQLATLKDAAVRLDVHNPTSEFHAEENDQSCFTTKAELLKTINERGIQLKQRQLDFLDVLDKDTDTFAFGQETKRCRTNAYAFRALKLMVESIYPLPSDTSLTKVDNYLAEFIDILEKFSKMNFSKSSRLLNKEQAESFIALGISVEETDKEDEYKYRIETTESYLHEFILNYLKDLKNGKEFSSEAQLDALKRFTLFDENQLRWLRHIEYGRHHHHNFSEISKGLFYFFDYFQVLGVEISTWESGHAGLSNLGGFIHLKHILDCISLSGGGKNTAAQQLQAKYATAIPRDFTTAKAQLRAGYAFIHESMLFGYEHYFDHNIPTVIPKEEFSRVQYGYSSSASMPPQVYFRTMYLRYIASQVDPNCVGQAVKKWEDLTNTPLNCWENWNFNGRQYLDIMDEALQKNWEELKKYALSLPSRLAPKSQENVADKASYTPEAFINQRLHIFQAERLYSLDHIQTLLSTLNLPEKLAEELLVSIQAINDLALEYANLSESELEAEIKSARNYSLEKQIAILRETHCRLTCAESKANPPQGEWLRLEQLMAILIALKQSSILQVDTSEGKTLIIQMIALLKVLNGKKVDVLTHNESLALEAADEIKKLSNYFGIKVAKKEDMTQLILDADILYIDAPSAVINDLLAQFADEEKLPGHRQADEAVVDEVDNVAVDINANTTMQVSQGSEEADEALEAFLVALNAAVREQLPKKPELQDKVSQRQFVRENLNKQLADNQFYKKICANNDELDKYVSAAISAMQLIAKTHYVIEDDDLIIKQESQVATIPRKVVRIIHKDTTGRVDEISQWGAGVHQCIAAWEKQRDKDIVIPGTTQVLAEADVALYLKNRYKLRNGLTATLGDAAIRKKIEEVIDTNLSVVMPRAVRPLDSKSNWPLKARLEGQDPYPEYNRVYRFPPIYASTKATHQQKLLEAIQNIQNEGQSCVIFLNTVNECDEFFKYLVEQGINTRAIQILDDTHDEKNATQSFRPPESTVIARAKESKMITLTTAAGSRGTNFNGIDVGILAKPSLGRVTFQKSGRIARNGQFGLVYEIYCSEDLDKSIEYVTDTEKDPMSHRPRIFTHEKAAEARNLAAIEAGKKERQAKWTLQESYVQYRTKVKDKHALDSQWTIFFSQIKNWDEEEIIIKWEQFKQNTQTCC